MILRFVIFFCLVVNTGVLSKYRRIVGGTNVDIKDYPFMAALKYTHNGKQYCGGAIISEQHIITAAHCVDRYSIHKIRVSIGSNARSSSGLNYTLQKVDIHPEYTGRMTRFNCLYHDIAVITVKGCIQFNEFQHRVKLPTNNIRNGSPVTSVGWGKTSYPRGKPSEILQMAAMKIIRNKECMKKTRYAITPVQICAFKGNGTGICVGDSGGPLISADGVLVGITSFSYLCAKGLPDVYTRIFYYRDFINSILRETDFQCCTIL